MSESAIRRTPLLHRFRRLSVIAQDPSVRSNGRIVRATVDVPAEHIEPGPRGYRVEVVDFDSTTGIL